jgi:hypothetical protein
MADEHGKRTHKAFQSVHYSFLAMHNYMRRNVVLKELICTKPCKDIKENKVFLWLVLKKCCLKKKAEGEMLF